jgi:leucyl-tRNA synthetase
VNLYIGGREHAILHLIYARFFTKFLHDIGLIDFDEPFTRMYAHGLVQGESIRIVNEHMNRYISADELDALQKQGKVKKDEITRRIEKMSKSKKNGADPTELMAQYGADAVRLTILFLGPADADSVWDPNGIKGPYNFLRRWHDTVLQFAPLIEDLPAGEADFNQDAKHLRRQTHTFIDKATSEFNGRLAFNTVIARGMELVNDARAFVQKQALAGPCSGAADPTLGSRRALQEALSTLSVVLSPFAPHTAEETWAAMGGAGSVFEQAWPKADPEAMQLDEIELPVQVNGKVRGTIRLPSHADKQTMEKLALENENVKRFVEGKAIHKLIVVPGRIINVVAK